MLFVLSLFPQPSNRNRNKKESRFIQIIHQDGLFLGLLFSLRQERYEITEEKDNLLQLQLCLAIGSSRLFEFSSVLRLAIHLPKRNRVISKSSEKYLSPVETIAHKNAFVSKRFKYQKHTFGAPDILFNYFSDDETNTT